jgi:hypothetical protein
MRSGRAARHELARRPPRHGDAVEQRAEAAERGGRGDFISIKNYLNVSPYAQNFVAV